MAVNFFLIGYRVFKQTLSHLVGVVIASDAEALEAS
jgi:hypothetical protein